MSADFVLPRIKVCGTCRLIDALVAVEAGADAIGMVFHEASPRSVPLPAALRIAANLPPTVLPVGVYVDADPERTLEHATIAGVRMVQLCGSQRAEDWRAFPLPLLRRLGVDAAAADELEAWRGIAAGFVLDHPSAPGGTGRQVDAALAAQLAAAAPCLLAGGLDETRVAAAIHAVHPFGVDAASRLETAPGRKDPDRVRAFVRAAHSALEECAA
ncbi:MAG TPA: phosphoribosylanthranilate isomerase [Planctomycetota bacterium]